MFQIPISIGILNDQMVGISKSRATNATYLIYVQISLPTSSIQMAPPGQSPEKNHIASPVLFSNSASLAGKDSRNLITIFFESPSKIRSFIPTLIIPFSKNLSNSHKNAPLATSKSPIILLHA